MKPTCPVCGEPFWCDWPNQWIYKRKGAYLCSWRCIREYDRKEAERMEQEKLKKKPGRKPKQEAPAVELVYDQSIAEEYRAEQEAKKAEQDPKEPEVVWETTAVRSPKLGEFYYDKDHGTVDWRIDHDEMSLYPETWELLAKELPWILKRLKAEV